MSRGSGKVTGNVVIASFVVAVIALALTPTVATMVESGSAGLANFTSAQDILELFPVFWSILALAIPVTAIGLYFRGV